MGQGVLDLPVGRGIPEEIWEQMSLLFGELSKEELLRQVVLTELRKLDTGTKADLTNLHTESPSAIGATKTDGKRPSARSPSKSPTRARASRRRCFHPQWEDSKPGKPMGRARQEEAQEKRRFQARR